MAQQVGHPFSLAWAFFFAAVVHQLRRERQEVQTYAEAVIALSSQHEFPYWLAKGTVLYGWAVAERGQGRSGIAQMLHGLAAHQATGSELWRSYYYTLLAEAYQKEHRAAEGMIALTEALTLVERTGERFYEAELYRLKGELLLMQEIKSQKSKVKNLEPRAQAEAEACFLKAIESAHQQHANSLELRAVMSLVRQRQQQAVPHASRKMRPTTRKRLDEAHWLLSDLYHSFTEGFDTKDLREAKTLLEDLA